MEQIEISLSELKAGKDDPRVLKADTEQHKQLKSSIQAHGLLQPLVVQKNGKGYNVLAGRRRLKALNALKMDSAPCVVVDPADKDSAFEIALAENMVRVDMHPLDEAEAIYRLLNAGYEESKIADHFGRTLKWVQQRQKLAGLSTAARTAFRDGAFGIATAENLTLASPEDQTELVQRIKEADGSRWKRMDAEDVRTAILRDAIPVEEAIFDVDEYPPELITSDLFDEGKMLLDRQKFYEMQQDAIPSFTKQMIDEGWSDVKVFRNAERYEVMRNYKTLDKSPILNDEDEQQYNALTAQADAIRLELEPYEGNYEAEDDINAIYDRLENVQHEIQNLTYDKPKAFRDDQKAGAFVFIITMPEYKRFEVIYGVVPDVPDNIEPDVDGMPLAEDDPANQVAEAPLADTMQLSKKQKEICELQATMFLRHEIRQDPELANAILMMTILNTMTVGYFGPPGFGLSAASNWVEGLHGHDPDALRASPYYTDDDAIKDKLRLVAKTYAEMDLNDALTDLVEMDAEKRNQLIADLVSYLWGGRDWMHDTMTDWQKTLLSKPLLDRFASDWHPDQAFLSGYTKAQLIALTDELGGHGDTSAKKPELISALLPLISNQNWLPSWFTAKEDTHE